jgi:CRP-like cAMP-binding protein
LKATEHPFYHHLKKYVSFEDDDFPKILSYFETIKLNKKDLVMQAGNLCSHNYFVLKGCLHMYFTTEKGTERTVQFALECWWLTDFLAFQNHTSTNFNVQAVEKSQVLSLSNVQQELLLEEFPMLERYFRTIYQIAYGATLVKLKYLYDLSKEEIYLHFIEHFPEFAQRVPQYLIASFLGLTPEYVSEIRAKNRS